MPGTVYALLVSFFGPILDHHYAERQTNHEHIYLGHAQTTSILMRCFMPTSILKWPMVKLPAMLH